jgi:hypothetical protein
VLCTSLDLDKHKTRERERQGAYQIRASSTPLDTGCQMPAASGCQAARRSWVSLEFRGGNSGFRRWVDCPHCPVRDGAPPARQKPPSTKRAGPVALPVGTMAMACYGGDSIAELVPAHGGGWGHSSEDRIAKCRGSTAPLLDRLVCPGFHPGAAAPEEEANVPTPPAVCMQIYPDRTKKPRRPSRIHSGVTCSG